MPCVSSRERELLPPDIHYRMSNGDEDCQVVIVLGSVDDAGSQGEYKDCRVDSAHQRGILAEFETWISSSDECPCTSYSSACSSVLFSLQDMVLDEGRSWLCLSRLFPARSQNLLISAATGRPRRIKARTGHVGVQEAMRYVRRWTRCGLDWLQTMRFACRGSI